MRLCVVIIKSQVGRVRTTGMHARAVTSEVRMEAESCISTCHCPANCGFIKSSSIGRVCQILCGGAPVVGDGGRPAARRPLAVHRKWAGVRPGARSEQRPYGASRACECHGDKPHIRAQVGAGGVHSAELYGQATRGDSYRSTAPRSRFAKGLECSSVSASNRCT
jgi:hypothetical protein